VRVEEARQAVGGGWFGWRLAQIALLHQVARRVLAVDGVLHLDATLHVTLQR